MPPGTSIFAQEPPATNFQELPWKSTVEVPWQDVPAPAAQSFCPFSATPKHFSLCAAIAAASSPFVKGAALRVSMPYLDPKIYDDSAYEAAKYAERRDDIGRLMLSVMMQVRNQLGRQNTTT